MIHVVKRGASYKATVMERRYLFIYKRGREEKANENQVQEAAKSSQEQSLNGREDVIQAGKATIRIDEVEVEKVPNDTVRAWNDEDFIRIWMTGRN